MVDMIIQILIFTSACTAIALISRKEHWSRWGYIIGIIGQPLWLYDSYGNNQWGIFVVSIWFLISYAQGIKNYWIRPDKRITSKCPFKEFVILEISSDVIELLKKKAEIRGHETVNKFMEEILTWVGTKNDRR